MSEDRRQFLVDDLFTTLFVIFAHSPSVQWTLGDNHAVEIQIVFR